MQTILISLLILSTIEVVAGLSCYQVNSLPYHLYKYFDKFFFDSIFNLFLFASLFSIIQFLRPNLVSVFFNFFFLEERLINFIIVSSLTYYRQDNKCRQITNEIVQTVVSAFNPQFFVFSFFLFLVEKKQLEKQKKKKTFLQQISC